MSRSRPIGSTHDNFVNTTFHVRNEIPRFVWVFVCFFELSDVGLHYTPADAVCAATELTKLIDFLTSSVRIPNQRSQRCAFDWFPMSFLGSEFRAEILTALVHIGPEAMLKG